MKCSIILRKQKLSNGEYPICIRLTMPNQSASYLRIENLSCQEEEWSKDNSRMKRNKADYKALNIILSNIEIKIDSIATRLAASDNFTYHSFKSEYYKKKVDNNAISAFNKYIADLVNQNRLGTAKMYSDGLTALQEYTHNRVVTFDMITIDFLKGFESQRLKKGNKINTCATYLRGLRSIVYHHHKVNGLRRPDTFLQFTIKTEETRKLALTKSQLHKLLKYVCKSYQEQRSIDIYFFSFYARGINIMDIAKLRKTNIVNGRIEYQRSKTKGKFSVLVTTEIQTILNRYSNPNSKYLLPILKNNSDNVRKTVVDFTRTLNKILRRIALNLEIPRFSFYSARHSFANALRENNTSIDLISQSLGHSNTTITKTYLKDFDNKDIDSVSVNLL